MQYLDHKVKKLLSLMFTSVIMITDVNNKINGDYYGKIKYNGK